MSEIVIESEDSVERRYEILGKILQSEKRGLAELEKRDEVEQ